MKKLGWSLTLAMAASAAIAFSAPRPGPTFSQAAQAAAPVDSGPWHATLSPAINEGARLGPEGGLGKTPPTMPAPRGGARGAAGAARGAARAGTPPAARGAGARGSGAPTATPLTPPPPPDIPPAGRAVEQTTLGTKPAPEIVASFDGLGEGLPNVAPPNAEPDSPPPAGGGRNPSDNALAVGPTQIVQIVNSRLVVFDKVGKVLYGPVPTNTVFAGFGDRCKATNNGDAVVRYDHLANRWLIVMPIFSRPAADPTGPYGMCYAVSTSSDALGTYNRYEFQHALFPDYPRPAIWPDGYYVPSSTGDTVIQKHDCIADRAKMLKGEDATEQCVIIDGVSFLNNADVDGSKLPPPGAPNVMLAAGGTQLKQVFEDDGIYAYNVHVDWSDPAKTTVTGPRKIAVAPYHFLCNGQLSNCVPQPGTDRRLDAQGDKLMERVTYRNVNGHESILALHSIDTAAHGGGVRWYEFRLDKQRNPQLYQQGTYAPGGDYRWMPAMAMDKKGNIGIGYSYGGENILPGQRFAARMANDPKGQLTTKEAVLVAGQAAQTNTLRWEDYTTTVLDPTDDCTFWYTGDYIKTGDQNYTTRIGAFRLPGCQ